MNREEALEVWAPQHSRWGVWTKPTLFSFMSDPLPDRTELADRGWRAGPSQDTAILVELAGQEAVFVGLQVARSGYRPVLLFNACPFGLEEDSSTARFPAKANFAPAWVDVTSILQALERNTNLLKSLNLPESAPPAFLLDANRSSGPLFPDPGIFDNRSVVRESDLPGGDLLKEAGIRRVVLIRTPSNLGRDLRPILMSWQTAGLQIQMQEPGREWNPQEYVVTRPTGLSILFDKLVLWLSFRTNSQGSFGRTIRAASS